MRDRHLLLLIAGVVAVAVFFLANSSDPSQGCPAGTTWDPAGLMETCDSPSGATACVRWAAGFTPTLRDRGPARTYYSSGIPGVGRWCPGATSPPPGS